MSVAARAVDPAPKPAAETVRRDDRGVSMEPDIRKGVDVINTILTCSDEQFKDRGFILKLVEHYGIVYNDFKEFLPHVNCKNASQFGLLQLPTEFTDFAMILSTLGIETSIEIGVFRGASSYFLAAVLQRANPKAVYHMVDISPNFIVAYEEFSKILNLKRYTPSTSNDFRNQIFDFVFIDGDHSYDGALLDYLNVGRYCKKVCAFHDVSAEEFDHLNGGIRRTWREVCSANAKHMRMIEISHAPTAWVGIGLMLKPPYA